jgi:hypothetical protein
MCTLSDSLAAGCLINGQQAALCGRDVHSGARSREAEWMTLSLRQNILEGQLNRARHAVPDSGEVNHGSDRPAHEFGQFA